MVEKNEKDTRKIQVTGGSTYIVSLPKKWVEQLGLGAGDEMTIEPRDSSLFLSPSKLQDKGSFEVTIEVEPDEDQSTINRKILSLYLVGYNVIRIRSSEGRLKSPHRNAIKDLVRKKLVGTEIISESMEEVTLRILLSYSELSVKNALRRMYSVASSMAKNAMVSLEEYDKELAKDVMEIDDEVDRFQMYLIREIKAAMQNPSIIDEIGLSTLRECLGYRLVSKHVERVGDHAGSIAKNVLEMEHEIGKEPLKMLEEISTNAVQIFDKAVDSLFKGDYDAAEEVIQEIEDLYGLEERINKFLAERDPPEAIRIRLILESIRRIAEYGSDIAEIVLNLTITEDVF